jgi:exopolysaccharide biosynthesis operon protein EpsL
MRVSALTAAVSSALALTLPGAGWAYQTLDDFRFPESGAFPAYPAVLDGAGRYVLPYVYGGVYRDNNIFRLPASQSPQSDTWWRLGAGIRANIPVSRQRFFIEAQVDENRFNNNSFLDNTGTRLTGNWDWEAGNLLTGNLGVQHDHGQGGFGQVQAAVSNVYTANRSYGQANLRITPDWRVRAGFNTYKTEADDASRRQFDNNQTDWIFGTDYISGLNNSVGLQWRESRGAFPNQQINTPTGVTTLNSEYKEEEPAAVIHYAFGGKSSFDARFGYTRREHDQLPARDYQGSTGNVTFHWTPSPKTLLDFNLFRETRPYVTSAIGAVLTSVDTTAAYVIARGIRFEPRWAITDQVVLQAQLLDERDTFKGDPTVPVGAGDREDKFRAGSIGLGWSPLRPVRLSLSYERGDRSSNIVNRDFKYQAVSLNARYIFF